MYNSGAAIPLIVTVVPLEEITGRGVTVIVSGLPEDRPVPNTLISIPGAKDCVNDAPFPTDVTAGRGEELIPLNCTDTCCDH